MGAACKYLIYAPTRTYSVQYSLWERMGTYF